MNHIDMLCQQDAINELRKYKDSYIRSIIIEGHEGCGKSYLSNYFGKHILGIEDIIYVKPAVQDIRTCIETCLTIDTPIVVVIENLDLGVPSASYALLKFIEDIPSRIHCIVTCRDVNGIPSTILSRSQLISILPPRPVDLSNYAKALDEIKYGKICNRKIWSAIKSMSDVKKIFDMTPEQIDYIESLNNMSQYKGTISMMAWNFTHYPDNSDLDIKLAISYIISTSRNRTIIQSGIDCINDIESGKIAKHAIIARFLFDCKYCE